jgi:dipeptide/tripeptide permease
MCNIVKQIFKIIIISAIFPLFLHLKLGLTPNTSTSLFHIYEGTTCIFNILGAMIADTWLGLHKCISIMTFVYVIGLAIVSLSVVDPLQLPVE